MRLPFNIAMFHVSNGSLVRRQEWMKGAYLKFFRDDDGVPYLFKHYEHASVFWVAKPEDIFSDDWEIVQGESK